MKYLKSFNTYAEYQAYINGSNKILPNVSYCKDNNEVYFNPWVETKLVCKYNITDTSSATSLRTEYEPNMFKSMEIDGVLLDNMVTSYQFDTIGEHTVKYELYNETKVGNQSPLFRSIITLTNVFIPDSVTSIGDYAFNACNITNIILSNNITSIGVSAFQGSSLINILIPNSVTTIDNYAFDSCGNLTGITIGNSVTSMGTCTFGNCSNLETITSLATTAPTIQSDTFQNINTDGTLTVPSGNTGYDTWMGTGDYYLGKYNWTKVEQ